MPRDQNTIGLSTAAAEHLRQVLESGWFSTELDACRVAMGLALSQSLDATEEDLQGLTTKYNVGTFDRDGSVESVLKAVGQPKEYGPYEYAERLIHAGLKAMSEAFEEEGALLSDVMAGGEAR